MLASAAALSACGSTGTDAVPTPGAATASDDPRAMQTIVVWRAHVDTLALRVAQLDSAAVALRTDADVPRVKSAFVEARRAFKLSELALEYYTPTTAKEMNGPALPEVDDEEGPEAVFPPTGFQVIEEALYGDAPVSELAAGGLREIGRASCRERVYVLV